MNLKEFILSRFSLPVIRNEINFCFYIEKKARLGKYHVIHTRSCELLPNKTGRQKLGFYEDYLNVITEGEKYFEHVRLCTFCCRNL